MKKINFSPLPEDIQAKKQAIWSKIEQGLDVQKKELSFKEAVNLWFEEKMPSRLASMQAKEKLFLRLASLEREYRVEKRGFSLRQVSASLVLASLAVGLFFPVSLVMPQAYASAEDQLVVEQGEVFVNGMKVEGMQVLQEGDRIQTGEGAQAQVYLADDSRIAMDEGTILELATSSMGPSTQSILKQESGRVWVQVVNLVDSQLQLLVPEAEIIVDYQSTFESSIQGSRVALRMFKHMAKISEPTILDQDMLLTEGTRLELAVNDWRIRRDQVQEEDAFIQKNQALEQAYREDKIMQYKKEVKDAVWISPGHFLYPVKRLRESVQESVTPGPLKDKVLQSHAKERLKEYHQALEKGALEEAKSLAMDFDETVQKIDSAEKIEEVKALDIRSQKILVLEDKEAMLFETKSNVDLTIAMNAVVEEAIKGESEKAQSSWQAYQGSVEAYMENIEEVPLKDRQDILADFIEVKQKERLILETIALESEETWQKETMQNLNTLMLSIQTLTPDWTLVESNENFADEKKMFDVLSAQSHLDEEVKNEVKAFVSLVEQPNPVLVVTPDYLVPLAPTDDAKEEEGDKQEEKEDSNEEENAPLPDDAVIPEDPRFKSPFQ